MKLSYEDKVQLYELHQNGESINSLSKKFRIDKAYIKYMFRLIDRYGIGIVKKRKNIYYSPDLKSEMFYDFEKTFKSLDELKQAIIHYIDYYNNKRIKVKLKGLSPVQYRTKSFQ